MFGFYPSQDMSGGDRKRSYGESSGSERPPKKYKKKKIDQVDSHFLKIPVELLSQISRFLGTNADRLNLARSSKKWKDELLHRDPVPYWESGQEELATKIQEGKVRMAGLDEKFEELNRKFRFSADNLARTRVLSYAVAHDDLGMVKRARELRPEMTAAMVLGHDPFFFNKALTQSGPDVLEELRNWWGVEQIKPLLETNAMVYEVDLSSHHKYFVEYDPNKSNGVLHLDATLDFLRDMGAPLGNVLKNNQYLIIKILRLEHVSKRMQMLQKLIKWGMTVEDVRRCDKASLWSALSTAPEALSKLIELGLQQRDAYYDGCMVLRKAAEKGQIEVLRVLAEKLGLGAQHARVRDNDALRRAAANGHDEVLNMLHSQYGLTTNDAQTKYNEALRTAAANGHFRVLEVLHTNFGLTTNDAQTYENEALRKAAAYGHADVVRILCSVYKLKKKDAQAQENEALRRAAAAGHAAVLLVLGTQYKLTRDDAQTNYNEALRSAAAAGHAAVLVVLASRYRLTRDDAITYNNEAFRQAARFGYANVLRVLASVYKLTAADAKVENNEAVREAMIRGSYTVMKVLAHNFKLERDDALSNLNIFFEDQELSNAEATAVLTSLRSDYKLQLSDLLGNSDISQPFLRAVAKWCERVSSGISSVLIELVEGWGLGGEGDAAGRALMPNILNQIRHNNVQRNVRIYLNNKLGTGWDNQN